MRFEQNYCKILILSFKNHLHIFWLNYLGSVIFLFFLFDVCVTSQKLGGTEYTGSENNDALKFFENWIRPSIIFQPTVSM